MSIELCHCGKPLHYTDLRVELFVRKLIADRGAFVPIAVIGDTEHVWMVQRHYIALHGIKAAELPSLGFEKRATS